MKTRQPEVADVLRNHGSTFLERFPHVSSEKRRVLSDLSRCRTSSLGAHRSRCETCGHEEISYNSCRNRHCPKCQASGSAKWLDREQGSLLDVEYFHVVFTLPDDVGDLALQNRRVIYNLLFRAASETLSTIASDPKHLGANIGSLMVLHTWGQNLHHHPHVHCVVPGGGLTPDGSQWKSCRKGFFLPVRVLSRFFRNRFVSQLEKAFAKGTLTLEGNLSSLRNEKTSRELIASLKAREWVVYSKPPFGGPEQVLKYLARYTHRVAISNRRIVSLDDDRISFRWKNYKKQGKTATMALEATEFIRRFLLHVLPKGFVRIRHYGFLGNRVRKEKVALIRELLDEDDDSTESLPRDTGSDSDHENENTVGSSDRCPRCRTGKLVVVERFQPGWRIPDYEDTS